MLVREIMTANPVHITADADLDAAIELLAQHHITVLPVVDEGNHLIGVISEIDVLRRVVQPDGHAPLVTDLEHPPAPLHIDDIMFREPRSTTEGTDVADLVRVFVETSIKSLPVLRAGQLVGIVSRSDIIRALWRSDDELRDDLVGAYADYGQDGWKIDVTHGIVTITGTDSHRDRSVAVAIARSVLGVREVRVVVPD